MVEQRETSNQELLKLEYQECASHSRFTVGHRFTYFVSFSTFFFVLIAAYNYVWTAEAKIFGQLKPVLLSLITLFGIINVFIAWVIEKRNVQIYQACDNRAASVERLMEIGGVGGGIWQILTDPERKKRFIGILAISHVTAISFFYGTVLVVWLLLAVVNMYLLWFV